MNIPESDQVHRVCQANQLDLKPLAVPVKRARSLLGIGNTKMWELIKTNRVATISIGRRRLVVFASLEALIAQSVERVR
jgi:hypothetical protein